MPYPRIDGGNGRRQPGTTVGDNQPELLAFQPASVEILEQTFPVGLALPLAAQKRQQMARAVAPRRPPACAPACAPPDAAPAGSRRPKINTRSRRLTGPDETGAPPRPDRGSTSIPSAHSPPRRSAWPPPVPPAGSRCRAKTLPGSAWPRPPPAAETVPAHAAESSCPACAPRAAGSCPTGSRNPARSSRCGRAAAAGFAAHRLPALRSDPVAAANPIPASASTPAGSRRTHRPRNFPSSPLKNVGNAR
jgi:hypothetical protein